MKKPIEAEAVLAILESQKRPKGNPVGKFCNVSTQGRRAVLSIYDAIGSWDGVGAREFRDTLKALAVDVIELRLNSPGGSVFEGVAIYNMLVDHPAKVEVHVDGLAASIASVIAMAGDEIHVAENAMMMIHDPSVGVRGDAATLRRYADILDKIKESIVSTYEGRTGAARDEIAAWMTAETYMTADEAVERKFATHKTAAMKAAAEWSADDFADLPEPARAHGKTESAEPDPVPDAVGTVDDVTRAAAMLAAMKQAHGL